MSKNVEITKKFTTKSGSEVTVTGKLILEKTNWADGDTITVDTCEIYVNVDVTGKGSQGSYVRPMTAQEKRGLPAGYNWICGRLALTDEHAEIIRSVRAELEQHPAWQAMQARIERNTRANAEYERTNGRLMREMHREDSDY